MFRRCAPALGVLLLFSTLSVASACAGEKPASVASPRTVLGQEVTESPDQAPLIDEETESPAAADAAPPAQDLSPVLDVLVAKKVIGAEEAASLKREGHADSKALIELLRQKGVISEGEADQLRAKAPSQDQKFIAQLRERWVKNGNRRRDFDEWFAGNTDPDDIIGRMRVMGGISSEEAEALSKEYRDNYLSGQVAATLDHKEQQYLERVRKDVAFDLDEKIKEQFKNDWTRRIKMVGDVRLRYEGDFYDANNGDFLQPSNPTQILNSHDNQELLRLRARLGVEAKVAEQWQAGIVIATDNSTSSPSPVSTNATLGNSFNKKAIYLDKAYLKWSPDPSLYIVGGHFGNPWLYTDLVWDPDLNFDGIAASYTPQLNDRWGLFVTGGAFPVQFVQVASHDKWLFGGQGGMSYKSADNLQAKLGVAYYQFINTVGEVNSPSDLAAKDYTAPSFQQKGNTLMDIDPGTAIKTAYASAFRELNVTGVLDLGYWESTHLILVGDYVNNLGFNQYDVEARTGRTVSKETQGYQVGFSLGSPQVRDLWDWNGYFYYKYLESDAVMDAFTDSDFHLGGTNAKGWILGGQLGLAKNVWLSARYLSSNEISGPPLSIDVLQIDINAKF